MNSTNYPDELYKKLLEFSSNSKQEDEEEELKLFNYQRHIFNYMTKTDNRGILLYHSVGSGKCMAINTPILMYDGRIKKIQDVAVGEFIMGDDSTERKVLSLARGVDDMYNIWYGSKKYTVNKEHILCLKTKIYPRISNKYKYPSSLNVFVEYLKNGEVKIKEFSLFEFQNNEDILKENINNFLKKEKEEIIHIKVKDFIKFSKEEQKLFLGYRERIYFRKNEIVKSPFLIGTLVAKGELENIHVDYKINTIFVREYVMAGIIGSIGIMGKYNNYDCYILNIKKKRKIFMNDFLFIADTLGLLYKSKLIKKNNIESKEEDYYKITLYGKYLENIHKKSIYNDFKFNTSTETIESGYRINVKYVGINNYFGFCINGNRRYVLADCSITHNTMTSISVAEHFKKLGRQILVLSSKSLQINYKKEIENFRKINNISHENLDNYKFITSNSRTMIDKITNEKDYVGNKMTNALDNILNHVNKESMDNKIIIVDEAHNLFNSIANGSEMANKFYDMVMKAKNVKLIFLTGTPVINDPFELSICYNMLVGDIRKKSKNSYGKTERLTILPEYYTDFHSFFISGDKDDIKNEGKFKNRIFGLTSYYGDFYTSSLSSSISLELKQTLSKENYPDRLPVKFEIVEMSEIQNSFYSKARETEKLENSRIGSGISAMDKGNSSTSYRIKSRQISNIYINEETFNYVEENKEISKFSTKIQKIVDNIQINCKESGNIMVYSTFLEYGVNAIASVLKANKWIYYNDNKNIDNSETEELKYAIFSGKQTTEEKEEILKTYNSEDNKNGKLIKVLFITKSGTEGLDLKNVRYIHITEPYWNYSLIQQIIARGVRYKSHMSLEEDKRNVQTYIYLSDYNKQTLKDMKTKLLESKNNGKKKDGLEKTTDIHMFKNAVKNQELIYKFLKIIASTSIECKFFNNEELNYKCFSCKNTNERLFIEDIYVDMKTKNNCIAADSKTMKLEAKEIIIDGNKYYYSISPGDNSSIYVYEKKKESEQFILSKDKDLINIILENLDKLKLKNSL
jgi:superfamily II DNA or RNA helicase